MQLGLYLILHLLTASSVMQERCFMCLCSTVIYGLIHIYSAYIGHIKLDVLQDRSKDGNRKWWEENGWALDQFVCHVSRVDKVVRGGGPELVFKWGLY